MMKVTLAFLRYNNLVVETHKHKINKDPEVLKVHTQLFNELMEAVKCQKAVDVN